MKIAVITGKFPSLNETFVLDHVTSLIDLGHDVHIYADSPKEVDRVHGDIDKYKLLALTTYRKNGNSKFALRPGPGFIRGIALLTRGIFTRPRATLNLLNAYRSPHLRRLNDAAPFIDNKTNYDVIHCHFPENGELAVSLRELGLLRGPVVTSFHGYNQADFANGKMWELYPKLADKGDLFLFCSEHMKQWYDEQGWGAGRALVHRNPVRVNLFRPSNRQPHSNGRVRLLSIGRFVEKKGFRYAITAVAKLLHQFPRVQYDIVGDGRERPSLEALIQELGVGQNIRLLGWRNREELLSLLAHADIFVAPSMISKDGDQEGIPVVLQEAMASALPVVSTWHTGIPELVRDGDTGFLVPERDSDAIAAKLATLIRDPELRREMGKRGRTHIHNSSRIELQTYRLLEIYRDLSRRNIRSRVRKKNAAFIAALTACSVVPDTLDAILAGSGIADWLVSAF